MEEVQDPEAARGKGYSEVRRLGVPVEACTVPHFPCKQKEPPTQELTR